MTIASGVGRLTSPYTSYVPFGYSKLGTSWQTYTIVTKAKGSSSNAGLAFYVGQKTGTIWLDNVTLQKGWRPHVYRRDFASGVALVNPEVDKVTIPLGGMYRRIRGTQDPATNTGSYHSSVTLPAQDGLVLLRTSALGISGGGTIGYGGAATIAGSLRSVKNAPLSDRRVALYVSTDGAKWTKTADATTTATGAYRFSMRPTRSVFYKTYFAEEPDNLAGFSSVVKVSVKAKVSTPVAPSKMYVSRSKGVYGFLEPRHAAGSSVVRIYRYRYVSGRWKKYGYVNAKAADYGPTATTYSASFRFPYKGRWRLRAYHSDSGHAASWSPGYDYVTVK
jgi:hypothetical protein